MAYHVCETLKNYRMLKMYNYIKDKIICKELLWFFSNDSYIIDFLSHFIILIFVTEQNLN